MLGKLMKYEYRATARWFLPLYTALLIFAVINKYLPPAQVTAIEGAFNIKQIITVITMFAYFFLVVGLMVVTFVVVIQRFYKSLLGDEGYLMFTLPVKTWEHVTSKLFIALFWNLLSIIIAFGSVLLLIPTQDLRELSRSLKQISEYLWPAGFIVIIVLCLVSLAFGIIIMYAAIALGHLFNKHKLLASFGMYLGISTLSQMIAMLAMPFFIKPLTNSLIAPTPTQFNTLFLGISAVTAAMAVGYFAVTNIILKRKLNLE